MGLWLCLIKLQLQDFFCCRSPLGLKVIGGELFTDFFRPGESPPTTLKNGAPKNSKTSPQLFTSYLPNPFSDSDKRLESKGTAVYRLRAISRAGTFLNKTFTSRFKDLHVWLVCAGWVVQLLVCHRPNLLFSSLQA
jgi:hypothetical protein